MNLSHIRNEESLSFSSIFSRKLFAKMKVLIIGAGALDIPDEELRIGVY